ncbi:MAG: endolytic transglycosylase MltG [Myxococcota bacterium]
MRRRRERLLVGALAAVIAAALAAVVWLMLVYPQRPDSPRSDRREVVIAPGSSARSIAEQLAGEGLLEHPRAFAAYVRVLGLDDELRSGPVLLQGGLSPESLARRIAFGRGPAPVRVTIPEGFTRFDIAARLASRGIADEAAFVALTADPPPELAAIVNLPEGATLEGYLFPETYDLKEDLGPERSARRMLRTFARRALPRIEEEQRRLSDVRFGVPEVVALASVVEKEAAVAEERALIAGVFLNRLRSDSFRPRHRLQADPTVSYGCRAEPEVAPSCAGFDGTITRAMLGDRANRFNSYAHPGVPPGPIANPGLASLEAVLSPATHEFLYFVARGDGRHSFSATLDAHNDGVRALRAREGRGAQERRR